MKSYYLWNHEDLEDIKISETGQIEKDKLHVFFYLYVESEKEKKKKSEQSLQNRMRGIDNREQTGICQKGGSQMVREKKTYKFPVMK